MPYGKFIVEVKPPRRKEFGELTVFEYDSAAKHRHQKRFAVLERVSSCVSGWHSRYAQYRDASFRVRELLADGGNSYGKRKGAVIDIFKELTRERGSRAAFEAALAAERWAEEDAKARKAAKAKGEKYVPPPKVKKVKVKASVVKTAGDVSRRDIRRAAKRACVAKEGNKENWRNYL
jgi:hypothetical protein